MIVYYTICLSHYVTTLKILARGTIKNKVQQTISVSLKLRLVYSPPEYLNLTLALFLTRKYGICSRMLKC